MALDPLDGALAGGDVDARALGSVSPIGASALVQRGCSSCAGRRAVGLLEHPLAEPDRHLDGVLAGEAGVQKPAPGAPVAATSRSRVR